MNLLNAYAMDLAAAYDAGRYDATLGIARRNYFSGDCAEMYELGYSEYAVS